MGVDNLRVVKGHGQSHLAIAPEALTKMSWTGSMIFSTVLDVIYNHVLAFIKAWYTLCAQ